MTSITRPASVWQLLKTAIESGKPASQATSEHDTRLAAAVLMVEMARADNDHSPAERDTLCRLLTQRFGLTPEEAETLTATAEKSADRAISLHEYLTALNHGMDRAQKQAVLKMLWQVAYADKRLDPQEEFLLRQISDLLHLDHSDFIRTKLEVLNEA